MPGDAAMLDAGTKALAGASKNEAGFPKCSFYFEPLLEELPYDS